MKHCDACKLDIVHEGEGCPLCGGPLAHSDAPARELPRNTYPDLRDRPAKYNFILRLFVFLSLLGIGLSILINLTVYPSFLWCLIVILAVVYLWLTIPPLLRRGINYAKRVVFMTLFTSLLMVGLDLVAGYRGWSVSYVVPSLLMAGLCAITLMMVVSRTSWAQYVFYQVLMGLFGFIPLVLYLSGLASNLVMVLVCAGLALGCILLTVVFGDRTLKSDFKRRFNL